MKLLFLGTGAGAPSLTRNVSALLLLFDQGKEVWLFDCGEGTQQQMMRCGMAVQQISHIFITHLHGDHLYGLPGLLATRSLSGIKTPVRIFGPSGITDYVDHSLKSSQTHLRYDLLIQEIQSNCRFPSMNYDQTGFFSLYPLSHRRLLLQTYFLHHTVESLAYVIYETDTLGQFHPQKAQAFGIQPGPMYAALKKGQQITLPNGSVIDGHEFTDAPIVGKKFAIFGDSRPLDQAPSFMHNLDLIVHEATFSQNEQAIADISGHSTAAEVARMAQSLQASHLILSHLSARYANKEDSLLQETKTIFPQVTLAYDFLQFVIK